MSSFPGYYVSNPALIVFLPRKENHEAPLGADPGVIEVETGGGKRYRYKQFDREVQTLTFMCNTAELAAFRTMHNTVGLNAFFYVNSDGVTMYVKKQVSFLYNRIASFPDYFTVTLELKQEPTDASLLA